MRFFTLIIFTYFLSYSVQAKTIDKIYLVETKNTIMAFTEDDNGKFLFQYYGIKPDDISQILKSNVGAMREAYPTFGINCTEESALYVTHSDGNLSTDLYLKSVETTTIDNNITF